MPKKLLTERTARIAVTMGMPALFYRWYYRADSLNGLTHNVLRFSGVAPVETTLIGRSGAGAVLKRFERNFPVLLSAMKRDRWLNKLIRYDMKGAKKPGASLQSVLTETWSERRATLRSFAVCL
jgi:putative NADPH-quinone reductase